MSANKKILFGAAAVLVAAGLMLGLGGCKGMEGSGGKDNAPFELPPGDQGYAEILEAFFQAIEDADGEALLSLYTTDIMADLMDYGEEHQQEFIDSFAGNVRGYWGKNLKTSYKISGVMQGSAYSFYEEEFAQPMEEIYKIETITRVEAECRIHGTAFDDKRFVEFMLIQREGHWRLVGDSCIPGEFVGLAE